MTATELAAFVELTVAARQARKTCLGSCLRLKEQIAMDALKDAIEKAEVELLAHRMRGEREALEAAADAEVRRASRNLSNVNPLFAEILAPFAGGQR